MPAKKRRGPREGLSTISISAEPAFVEAVKYRARSLDSSISAHIRRLIREDLRKVAIQQLESEKQTA
jgi:Ribbon-helix-helix protein, copG family